MIYLKRKNIVLFFFVLLAVASIFVLKLGQEFNNHLATDLHKFPSTKVHRKILIRTNPAQQTSAALPSSGQANKKIHHGTIKRHTTQIFVENQSDVYIKFSGMDIPREGDFPCPDSLARDSCLIQRKKLSDFELICDRIGPYCKGFVMKKDAEKQQTFAYFKRKLGAFTPNEKTDLFVKREFLEKAQIKY